MIPSPAVVMPINSFSTILMKALTRLILSALKTIRLPSLELVLVVDSPSAPWLPLNLSLVQESRQRPQPRNDLFITPLMALCSLMLTVAVLLPSLFKSPLSPVRRLSLILVSLSSRLRIRN
ncbi:unknown protein [Microcystis aeruginosa NIES-843]|uniref:Uncharacterized protein n=1 Tax=Microcystis aeruginosa (strain NIES-843 / IAM M-2473) TaxID=449447 RepID=B0JT95_MICAN|nr:unknown protein [Microcystis aeruginosa NIES-843]